MKVKNSKKKYISKAIKWYYMIPLVLLITLVPSIMKAKHITIQGVAAFFWTGSREWVDFYSYWKAIFIVFLTIITLFVYLGLYMDKKIPFKKEIKYYIPLSIYFIFVTISTALCYNKEIAFFGFVESYQGIYILFSYGLLTFLMINFINSEEEIKIVKNAFVVLIIIQGLLGISQFIGLDFFKSYLGRLLVSGDGVPPEDIDFIFGKGTIYGTLYNTNFVGSFAAIILPLSIAFYAMEKTKKSKIVAYCLIVLSISLWLGCNSRAGYVGVIAIIIFSIIFLRKEIIQHKKFVSAITFTTLIILIVFNAITGGRTLNQFLRLNVAKEVEKIKELPNDSEVRSNSVVFKDLIIEEDKFTIVTNYDLLTIGIENEEFYIIKDKDSKYIVSKIEDTITIDEEKYPNYKMFIEYNSKIVYLNAYNRDIVFYFTTDGVKVLGSGNRLTDPIVAKTFKLLDAYDRFASNRGYIWSRSIMMLPDVAFKGYGPDNYCIAFPHDDFLAKLNVGWPATMITDKPHNMFLQIAINTGIPSLIALLVLWGIYIMRGFKLYFNSEFDTTEKQVGFACLAAVIGYLVAGIFNDQIVSVAPLFWIVLGMGISINEKLIKEKLSKKNT
jgi:hypothetical protein